MRISFLFAVSAALVLSSEAAYSQSTKPTVIKVSYVTSPLSAKMSAMIKGQVSDPQQYAAIIQQLSDVKIYHSLYVDIKTNESVYKLDSVKEVKGTSIAGQVIFCHKDPLGNFTGQETFTGSEYYFNGKAQTLQWDISKEKKTIGKYSCTKATLKNSPDVSVWFTTQIPIGNGPAYYYGLPGLVVEADSYFESCSISQFEYATDKAVFSATVAKYQALGKGKTTMPLALVIASKQNFITMAENKIKQKQSK
ncbi:GLPGLI family protein [Hymenobacter arizonensis]|uniref:GLPGLI family protein n=1 Tax=Hymenobacter arizonensis TaxID=1227077 RepID=A0A1I6BFV0_HYMAR|nr:GLPGLI family protein [Hymenobacter arizonensis]SFQ79657.1 GLPGLI family protein [Hymenobacter arizonensis]